MAQRANNLRIGNLVQNVGVYEPEHLAREVLWLRPAVRPPKILLTQTSPPVEVSPNNHLDHLRRRFGRLPGARQAFDELRPRWWEY